MNHEPWYSVYLSLPLPARPDQLVGCRVASTDGVWIAKDASRFPQLLIQPACESQSAVKLMLRHLEIDPNCQCSIEVPSAGTEHFGCIRIRCTAEEPELQQFFFRTTETVLESLPPSRSADAVYTALEGLAELFRQLSGRSTKTLQGLWAELLVLSRATNIHAAARAWQISPRALVDFAADSEGVEVKSTIGTERRHRFKLEQLTQAPDARWVVISFVLREDPQGVSLQALWDRIEQRLGTDPTLRLHVAGHIAIALGDQWRFAESYRVNEEHALANARIYAVTDIPKLDASPFPAISNVEFTVDLSGTDPTTHTGDLIRNLFPIVTS